MMASDRTRDLEETLDDVKASPRELIGGGSKGGGSRIEYPKSHEFGSSLAFEDFRCQNLIPPFHTTLLANHFECLKVYISYLLYKL